MNTNTETNPTALHGADPRPILARAIATGATAVAAVSPDQLASPTPCTEMDVRALLGHLVEVLDRIELLGRGGDPFGIVPASPADDGWLEAFTAAADRATAAWVDDAVLDRPMELPWKKGAGRDLLATYLNELTVHTWDLAVATGQQPDWDDDVLALALDQRDLLPAENRLALFAEISASMGLTEVAVPFADAVAVPDDAPAIDRLVAWNGRDPKA